MHARGRFSFSPGRSAIVSGGLAVNLQARVRTKRALEIIREIGLRRFRLLSGEPVDPVARCLPTLSELLCEPLAVRTFPHPRRQDFIECDSPARRLALRGGAVDSKAS
jgi:hypothetical protein